MVPCAQGRVIVETARPALPYFATCTSYRRQVPSTSTPNEIAASVSGTSSSTTQTDQQSTGSSGNRGAISKNALFSAHSIAARPEDLSVIPWHFEDYTTIDSLSGLDRSSYPSYPRMDTEMRPDATSTRNSSIESELPRPSTVSAAPRKAYMDLRDAIALLDETCPNQEPSPSLTPRTPRTPLTPHPRNKRARSKSSDNSSSYSNERLNDRSFEKEGKEKKRPFLKKIGISKTEDKPFLAKLAPKIIGKPYLEKIGPSKAVEKPFLDKIGSSKTLDKFTFETPRYERRIERWDETCMEDARKVEEVKPEERRGGIEKSTRLEQSFDIQRRKSGKGPLLKMYSFETEDLDSTVQVKDNRDPLRGASLDDVLDSGPSSLPSEITATNESPKPETKERVSNGAELLKCRVTTSEEIIFTNASVGSDKEPNSWGNSPKKKWQFKRDSSTPKTPAHRKVIQSSQNIDQTQDSVPNSPMKRPISSVFTGQDEDSQADSSEKNIYSPLKTRRQTYEDLLDRNDKVQDEKVGKQAQFERRGISSDNLLSKDRSVASIGYQESNQIEKAREASSEDYLAHKIGQEYTRETFKQLQDKFRYHEIPTETYADFKRRTRGSVQSIIGRQQERLKVNNIASDVCDESCKDTALKTEEESVGSSPVKMETDSTSDDKNEIVRVHTVRSVLKKQQGIDHPSDQELDSNSSIRRPKRRIFHEPSQETMDLLTELRKVKSLLKTPSWEKDLELDKKPVRQPKRILLTDKEFCLSVERENSIRRPSKVINSLQKTEEGQSDGKQEDQEKEEQREEESEESDRKIPGPALFEKKCLSLDYADDEKPQRSEARAISLASTRNLPSETEEMIDYSDLTLICDSKSYSSDVFNTPTDEINEKERDNDLERNVPKEMSQNHCVEVDIAIPIDQRASSPKDRVQIQGRTSDLYEIISPRSTPFRVKKRLGKISVEETVKPESFTLGSKVDCRSTVAQKRTKCFPL
ncbi:uncharacterized protein LOC100869087 isoform X1 [Apis florea]|uniref:uncharacterized protein LOC100869087 isoform X1 n=1 Tax=Apis florea TaxID=7463 RepID=UPI0012FF5560|nr:uncharacterized protein LOC100869087 isoform X1 [Apis florea]